MTLRERLQDGLPELFGAFERSWQIAHEEWLPAITLSHDSFNSYPHLRNLERYLEQIVTEYESLHGLNASVILSLPEIYVMLCAILFRDIGRVSVEKGHGKKSREILVSEYARLGIPSFGLAETIGRIVEFHEMELKEQPEWLLNELRTVAVSPYGEIRQSVCAALLFLIDHLDGAFTRVTPTYVSPANTTELIGAFRRAVRGIVIDIHSQMAKVVISNDLMFNINNNIKGRELSKHFEFLDKKKSRLGLNTINKLLAPTDASLKLNNSLISRLGFKRSQWSKLLQEVHSGNIRVNRKKDPRDNDFNGKEWPHGLLLAITLADAKTNGAALAPIRSVLSSVGIPIKAWLLDYREHLFNVNGLETYEPIFHKEYLKRVAVAMWTLSVSIFAHNTLSYETLASQMCEPDIHRIRRSVRRLSIIFDSEEPFWTSQSHWKWRVRSRSQEINHCHYVAIRQILDGIDKLETPTGENE